MKKEIKGYLHVCYEDTGVYYSEKNMGNPHAIDVKLTDWLKKFDCKKVKISIENIK